MASLHWQHLTTCWSLLPEISIIAWQTLQVTIGMPPWMADWYGGGSSSGPIVETVWTLGCVSSETTGRWEDVTRRRLFNDDRSGVSVLHAHAPYQLHRCYVSYTWRSRSSAAAAARPPCRPPCRTTTTTGSNSLPRHDGRTIHFYCLTGQLPVHRWQGWQNTNSPLRVVRVVRGVARNAEG